MFSGTSASCLHTSLRIPSPNAISINKAKLNMIMGGII